MTSNIGRDCRDHPGYGFSHSDGAFLCNAFSNWPSSYAEWPLNFSRHKSRTILSRTVDNWATIALYIQSLAALAMLTTVVTQFKIHLQPNFCKWRLIMTTPIVHEVVFKFPRKTPSIKQYSVYYCRLIHQLLHTNGGVPCPHVHRGRGIWQYTKSEPWRRGVTGLHQRHI